MVRVVVVTRVADELFEIVSEFSGKIRESIDALTAEATRVRKVYNRQYPLTDEEVKLYPDSIGEGYEGLTAVSLQLLRDRDQACEQSDLVLYFVKLKKEKLKEVSSTASLSKRALRSANPDKPVYLCPERQEIISIADISRVSRDDEGKLIGYQRKKSSSTSTRL